MAIDNSFIAKRIRNKKSMIVAYCAFTNMPFVVCDPVSFNDQVWIFDNEALLQEFAKNYTSKKILLRGVQYQNKDFLRFFSSLFSLDVNELVFVEGNDIKTYIELDKLVQKPDFSSRPIKARPVTNPSLALTGLYFMQEAARPVPNEEKEDLKELEEELASNMVKAKYLLAIELLPGPESDEEKVKNKKLRHPVLKTKNNEVLQPIFTDPEEFQKYARGNKNLRPVVVPFALLEKMLVKEAKAFILNPMGFHILMPKELMAGLAKRFPNAVLAPNVQNVTQAPQKT